MSFRRRPESRLLKKTDPGLRRSDGTTGRGQADLTLSVQFAGGRRGVPHARNLRTWANAAYAAHFGGRRTAPTDMTVRIVGRAESRRLNRDWRGKDKPTNVLSFAAGAVLDPVSGRRSLGDLVICAPVVAREAKEQRKFPPAHWAHMVVHGVLHLLGYDHEQERDAHRMERREIAILRNFGFANPYEELCNL